MSTFERAADRLGLEIVRLPMGNGMWTGAERATCVRCGKTEDVIHSTKSSHLPPEIVIKKLKLRGWTFKGKKATCPDCMTPAQRVRLKPEPMKVEWYDGKIPLRGAFDPPPIFDEQRRVIETAADDYEPMPDFPYTITIEGEPIMPDIATLPEPREPSREQKRRIHDEIQGNWDERAGRYLGSASDRSIAEGLHVPPAWVADIRADFFGDSGENADMASFKVELAQHIEDVEKLVENAMASASRFDELLKEMKGLRSRLERIEKSVLPKR